MEHRLLSFSELGASGETEQPVTSLPNELGRTRSFLESSLVQTGLRYVRDMAPDQRAGFFHRLPLRNVSPERRAQLMHDDEARLRYIEERLQDFGSEEHSESDMLHISSEHAENSVAHIHAIRPGILGGFQRIFAVVMGFFPVMMSSSNMFYRVNEVLGAEQIRLTDAFRPGDATLGSAAIELNQLYRGQSRFRTLAEYLRGLAGYLREQTIASLTFEELLKHARAWTALAGRSSDSAPRIQDRTSTPSDSPSDPDRDEWRREVPAVMPGFNSGFWTSAYRSFFKSLGLSDFGMTELPEVKKALAFSGIPMFLNYTARDGVLQIEAIYGEGRARAELFKISGKQIQRILSGVENLGADAHRLPSIPPAESYELLPVSAVYPPSNRFGMQGVHWVRADGELPELLRKAHEAGVVLEIDDHLHPRGNSIGGDTIFAKVGGATVSQEKLDNNDRAVWEGAIGKVIVRALGRRT
jgi:hypothetical protein